MSSIQKSIDSCESPQKEEPVDKEVYKINRNKKISQLDFMMKVTRPTFNHKMI